MSGTKNELKIIFSVTNCICHDQRVLKIAETICLLNCDITIIGRKSGHCCEKGSVPFKTKRFRMLFKRGFLFYKFFNIRLFFFLLFHKCDLLVANDLDTLLPNFLVSKIKRIPLVYDSHEYFTGVPELQRRPVVKLVWSSIEKIIFPHLKFVITVSDSIAEKYASQYGIRPITVRNVARKSDLFTGYQRSELDIPEDHLLLIFQGGGINIDRGGDELLEAVRISEKVYLLIVGSGDVMPLLREKVRLQNLNDRVRFVPKLPWEELMRYTKCADAGLSLDKDTNLNYRYSLPNKLFDYISAGIPVIAGDLPEVKKIIEGFNCGIIIPSVTPDEINRAIIQLRENTKLLNKLKSNSVIASGSLNWEAESRKVTELYRKVLKMDK